MKVLRKFDYKGIELKIVKKLESYMNSKDKIEVTRIIAPNGGSLPYNLRRKETQKSIIQGVKNMLDDFCNLKSELEVKNELTKKI